jgi:soluble cytochrome b562
MAELGETVNEAIERAGESRLNSTVAILVALTATFIALASVKDRNLTLGMMQAQAKAVDTWNYYQAKSTKQNLADATADELLALKSVSSAGGSAQAAAAAQELEKRIENYRAQVSRYDREKEEVKAEAEGYEHRYEALNVRHDEFDMSDAAMSVAIALLGVTALTRKRWLMGVAAVFLTIGVLFGMAGFLNWNLHVETLMSWLA